MCFTKNNNIQFARKRHLKVIHSVPHRNEHLTTSVAFAIPPETSIKNFDRKGKAKAKKTNIARRGFSHENAPRINHYYSGRRRASDILYIYYMKSQPPVPLNSFEMDRRARNAREAIWIYIYICDMNACTAQYQARYEPWCARPLINDRPKRYSN